MYKASDDTVHPFNAASNQYDTAISFDSVRQWGLYEMGSPKKPQLTVKSVIFVQGKSLVEHEAGGDALYPAIRW